MPKKETPRLGELELKILNILWERGPATVREVLEALPRTPRPAYTTVLTMMRLMHEKGYLERKEMGKAHVYAARLREGQIKRGLIRNLVDNVFRGSAEAVLVRLLEEEKLSTVELARVRRLIEDRTREEKGDGSAL
jgi:BlaI family transcriptional regulator, penicillinase repressor